MAKPISTVQNQELTPEQQNEQALSQLLNSLVENADGVKQTAKLLQELNGSGILPALQALLAAKEQVAAIAVHQMLRPPVTNMMNNAMAAAGALTSIEPETTKKLLGSMAEGLKKAEQGLANNETTSVWTLMKVMADPDINRALTFGLNLLKGAGQGLKE
jgi:uncharacterized protein YjgD (DUF1641 family)